MIEQIKKLKLNDGATENNIVSVEHKLGIIFPIEYKNFIKYSNGAEGFISDVSYISIWSIEEIQSLNEGYAVDEFAPGLILFATDGGDTAYAFDYRNSKMFIVEVPLVGMSLDEVKMISDDFNSFLEQLITKVA